MSTQKHTPGPWRTQGWVPTWAYIPVRDAHNNLVASLSPSYVRGYVNDDVEANANLIAAAPELLAALRKADEFIRNGVEFGFIRMPSMTDPAHETPRAIADAIAKAEGRS